MTFYRKKYNAEQALTRFAAVARDEVNMDKLTSPIPASFDCAQDATNHQSTDH